ncbi:MAG: lytic transglycosylase domain-containing protein [Halobacteriovoraceae bacterium]|nr:lytic transglycosylase domain-containing protein [Halobacteriovoraceae bacterium]
MKSKYLFIFSFLVKSLFGLPVKHQKGNDELGYIYKYTKHDLKTSKYYDQLYYESKRGKPLKSTLNGLISFSKKTPLFQDEVPIQKKLSEIISKKITINNFIDKCTFDNKNIERPHLTKIIEYFTKICDNEFLEILKNVSDITQLNDQQFKYFDTIISKLSNPQIKTQIKNLLKIKFKNSNSHRKLGELLKNYYERNDLMPDKDILEEMRLDDNFLDYVQAFHSIENADKSYFTSEIRKMYNDFKVSILDEEIEKSLTVLKSIKNFYESNSKYINKSLIHTYLIHGAKHLLLNNKEKEGRTFLNYLKEKVKTNEVNEVHFYSLWGHLINDEYQQALAYIETEDFFKKKENITLKLLFWIAHIYEKNNQVEKSLAIYKELIEKSPMNYYSILALKKLSLHKRIDINHYAQNNIIENYIPLKLSINSLKELEIQKSLKRVNLWTEQKNDTFTEEEIKYNVSLAQKFSENKYISHIFYIGKLLSDKKSFLNSFKLIYSNLEKGLPFDEEIVSYLFPDDYLKKIKEYNKSLDPIVILSLIRQESAFNPDAISHVGARGLMQLMPATARMFQKRVKDNHLKNPNINLKIGIKYLEKLIRNYNGNLIFALAAYNAGENRIKEWKKSLLTPKDPLLQIESIPFDETRKYVKLIYRNIFYYKILFKEKIRPENIENTFKVTFKR